MHNCFRLFLLLPCLLMLFSNSLFAQQLTKAQKEILHILQTQQQAWNQGNLGQFMNGYWESDSLKFIGKNGITNGWAATLYRYKQSYPTQAEMGKLTFTILSMQKLDKQHYFVIGKWHLAKPSNKDAEGYFSLLWKKINGAWKIIADHSS